MEYEYSAGGHLESYEYGMQCKGPLSKMSFYVQQGTYY
jgi:hypothetical protein